MERWRIYGLLTELLPLIRCLRWSSEDGDKNACSVGHQSVLEHVRSKILWDGRSKRHPLQEPLYRLHERIAAFTTLCCRYLYLHSLEDSSLRVTLRAAPRRDCIRYIRSRGSQTLSAAFLISFVDVGKDIGTWKLLYASSCASLSFTRHRAGVFPLDSSHF